MMRRNPDLQFVQGILKRFGAFIYTGNLLDDIALMELELQDLHEWKLISDDDFIKARAILNAEANKL